MGEDEYDEVEIYDDGEPDESYVASPIPGITPRKNNAWFVLASGLQFMEQLGEAWSGMFNLLKGAAFERYAWQSERQRFFETAGPQIERLTRTENAEVDDATG